MAWSPPSLLAASAQSSLRVQAQGHQAVRQGVLCAQGSRLLQFRGLGWHWGGADNRGCPPHPPARPPRSTVPGPARACSLRGVILFRGPVGRCPDAPPTLRPPKSGQGGGCLVTSPRLGPRRGVLGRSPGIRSQVGEVGDMPSEGILQSEPQHSGSRGQHPPLPVHSTGGEAEGQASARFFPKGRGRCPGSRARRAGWGHLRCVPAQGADRVFRRAPSWRKRFRPRDLAGGMLAPAPEGE